MNTVPMSGAATDDHRTGLVDGLQPDAEQPEDRSEALCFTSDSTVGVVRSARAVTSSTPTTAAKTLNAPKKRSRPLKTFMLVPFMSRVWIKWSWFRYRRTCRPEEPLNHQDAGMCQT